MTSDRGASSGRRGAAREAGGTAREAGGTAREAGGTAPEGGGTGAPRWLTAEEARAWRGYRRMRVLLDLQITRDLARDSGLSGADYDVLSDLSEADGHKLRLGDLAAHLLWSKSRLSHQVSRMQQRGLVTREDCPSDGRGAELGLTEAGWQAIGAAAPPHVESVRRHFIDRLSAAQIRVLGDLAETVVAQLGKIQDG